MISWRPTQHILDECNLTQFMRAQDCADYDALYQWSIREPAKFWAAVLKRLHIQFETQPRSILKTGQDPESSRWCLDATVNILASCMSSAAPAIVAQRPGDALYAITHEQLWREVRRVAASFQRDGVQPGDAIAIAMPMTPTAVVAYLGIVWAGGVVVSIADSFAPQEISSRLAIADARIVVTQDVMFRTGKALPMYQKLIDADAVRCVVIPHNGSEVQLPLRDGDITWGAWLSEASSADMHIGAPGDAINILFSSGTTGTPKAIPWTHLTPIKCAMDAHFHHDVRPGDVLCWPTNLGWMMGPWLIFAALLNKATIALYDDAPLTHGFGEFVRDAGVTMLGVVPSIVKAWRASGCMQNVEWPSLRCYSSTGEASAVDDYSYLMQLGGATRPVIEYCGGTEIGGGYLTGTMLHEAQPATFTTPALGSGVVLLDEAGAVSDIGEVFLTTPSIGYSQRLLNADHHHVYYNDTPAGPHGEQLRRHGDQLERLPNGYYRALGRADDTMNLGGIKVSSAEIERVVNQHAAVHESAAIAVQNADGGPSQLVLYVVQDAEAQRECLHSELQQLIKSQLNPLFKIHELVLLDKLPRTASNKVMRRVLRDEYVKQ